MSVLGDHSFFFFNRTYGSLLLAAIVHQIKQTDLYNCTTDLELASQEQTYTDCLTHLNCDYHLRSTTYCLYSIHTLSVSDSNNAKTKKKTVRECDIINIKIKSLLYSQENEMAGSFPQLYA